MPDEPIATGPPKLSQMEEHELKRAHKDASAKAAALPDRITAELQLADEEGRKPIPIQPLTPIPANLVVAAIDRIKEPTGELGDICRDQRRACAKLGKREVAILSQHLKMILDAAGIGGGNAEVQG